MKWYAQVTGMRTDLKPLAWTWEKVAATTGGLFHDPSSGVASRVFPRFHPGLSAAYAAEAVTGVKAAVQAPVAVVDDLLVDEDLVDEDEDVLVDDVDLELLVLVFVVKVVAVLDALVLLVLDAEAVPGTHWE